MRHRAIPLLVAAAAALLLAGCSGTSTDESVSVGSDVTGEMAIEGGAPAMPEAAPREDAAAGAVTSLPTDRQIIKTAYVAMSVADVGAAASDVHALVARSQGLVSNEDAASSGDSAYANITAQIPADGLDAFIAAVSDLGTVDSVNVTASDVTTQVVDLDARIKALQASIDRMTQLMAEAQRIEDLLAIEMQITTRQAELDSLTAQRSYLADQVAMSTVTVSLTPESDPSEVVDAPGFVQGLQSGWAAFVSLVLVAFTALGFLLPFIGITLLIAIPIVVLAVRQSRRHRRNQAAGPAGAPSHVPSAPESGPPPAS